VFDDRGGGGSKNDINNNNKSIILLEELPNLHGQDAELQFRTIMGRHLDRSYAPTVLIFSDVSEGRHKPEDLERLIDPDNLYSPLQGGPV
jgi:hypothetical protein